MICTVDDLKRRIAPAEFQARVRQLAFERWVHMERERRERDWADAARLLQRERCEAFIPEKDIAFRAHLLHEWRAENDALADWVWAEKLLLSDNKVVPAAA